METINDPQTPDTNATHPEETTDTTRIAPEEPVSLRQLLARAGRVYDITIAVSLEEAEMDDLPMRGVSVLRRITDGDAGTPLAHVLRGGRISRQHGTQLIDTLVERGYIVRETDPEDRRRMRVSLTERGKAAAEAVRTAIDGLNAALAEKVTPEQLEASRAVLSALVALAPEGTGPDGGRERGFGPDRGFFPGGRGPRHDRGAGRGPRGPMRDFDPRGEGWGRGRGGSHRRDAMHPFAAPQGEDDRPERPFREDGEGRETFADPRAGRPCGPRGRHGHRARKHDRGGAPTIVHHVDTMIVNAGPTFEGRGSRRHGGRHDHRGHGRGGRSFGPWRGEGKAPEMPQPQADAPATNE
ncbi:MAG: MarR family winged helix-turn-helix transcriptional regulator [Thermomicrobiales bacterium]